MLGQGMGGPLNPPGIRPRFALHLLDSRGARLRSAERPIHKTLTLGQAFVAYAIFTIALFGAAKLKDQIVDWWNVGRLQPSGAL
jgi:hypothetical protein